MLELRLGLKMIRKQIKYDLQNDFFPFTFRKERIIFPRITTKLLSRFKTHVEGEQLHSLFLTGIAVFFSIVRVIRISTVPKQHDYWW